MQSKLVLENGTVFAGESFGAEAGSTGEIVFNTGLTGYQEIMTDPSYCGQIVVMTNPMIGNYGVNPDDMESSKPQAAGLVVREYSEFYSNQRATMSLGGWLREHGVPAIQGVDTRMLTRLIRTAGAMRAVIGPASVDDATLLRQALDSPSMAGLDLTGRVTCAAPYEWSATDPTPHALQPQKQTFDGHDGPEGMPGQDGKEGTFNVVVVDYGVKWNILRRLRSYGFNLTVVPSTWTAAEVLALNPDGVFLSNGPGDPEAVKHAIAAVKTLIEKKPVFGICLGHQLLALALGARTYKLKFGHRGTNHPVKHLATGRIEITSQNHGFAVDPDTLDPADVEITHVNLNDGTNEGFRHRHLPVFSVQYHPEASPGPHDSDYLFRAFRTSMTEQSRFQHA